jgi:isoquinoline 1-oxidoreductase beta subunit
MEPVNVDRRRLLGSAALAAGGLALGWRLVPASADTASGTIAAPAATGTANATAFSALGPWIRIGADDRITLVTPDAEMGQGIYTGLPQILAEELEADFDRVTVELSGANPLLANPMKGYQSSGQSMAVRGYYLPLRKVGAAAREVLVSAAAARWEVPVADCRAQQGRVVHAPTGRSLRYGELAAAAAALPVPQEPRLKSRSDFRLIGRAVPRKDTPAKVDGSALFGCDVRLPGMLHAAIRACPVMGGRLVSVDEAAARGAPGVRAVVHLPDAVAVVADTWWQAHRALSDLSVEFDVSPGKGRSTDAWAARLRAALDEPGVTGSAAADLTNAFDGGRIVEAVYEVPHLAHATMEPMSCAAHYEGEGATARCTIWAPSQTPGRALEAAARVLGLAPEQVTLHRTFLGGGFGRRFQNDFVRQCVQIAKAVGRPVNLLWSREEDMAHDYYRPAFAVRYRARLDGGELTALHARIAGPSIFEWSRPGSLRGKADPSLVESLVDEDLKIERVRVEHVETGTPLPIGVWRAVSHSQNGFFKDCFFDELAHAAGRDPLEFRLALLGNSRAARTLRAAAERAGWGRPLPKGRGRGFGLCEGYGTVCAQVAEVTVKDGTTTVDRIVAAVDCGLVVDPRNVEAQVEGGIVYGLSAAMSGAITFVDGAVEQRNFHDYPVLRMNEMPPIEVVMVESDAPPGGIGEPPTPPIAPAVCNAIFAATGERVRRLPLVRT